jgi:hypothetical protein
MSQSEIVSGNPARYFSTLPTLVDREGTALMVNASGVLLVSLESDESSSSSSSAVTSVNDTANSTTLLAANTSRKEAIIYNDSTAILYVKFGTTASATDFTYKVQPDGAIDDIRYTGRIDGIWASDASGAARITELT